MPTNILLEAADIVSRRENMSKDYVLEFYKPTEILRMVREYREEREANMDAIRERW